MYECTNKGTDAYVGTLDSLYNGTSQYGRYVECKKREEDGNDEARGVMTNGE